MCSFRHGFNSPHSSSPLSSAAGAPMPASGSQEIPGYSDGQDAHWNDWRWCSERLVTYFRSTSHEASPTRRGSLPGPTAIDRVFLNETAGIEAYLAVTKPTNLFPQYRFRRFPLELNADGGETLNLPSPPLRDKKEASPGPMASKTRW